MKSFKDLIERVEKLEAGHENHETRISDLERWPIGSAGSTKSLKITRQKTGPSNDDKLKEIEAECQAVGERIQKIEEEIHKFLKVDYEDHDEVKRMLDDLLRNLAALKAWISSLEDRAKIIVFGVEDKKDSDRGAILSSDIDNLKERLKKLEDDLRALKKQKFTKQIQVPIETDGSVDYLTFINQLKDQMEWDVHDLNERINNMGDNDERLR